MIIYLLSAVVAISLAFLVFSILSYIKKDELKINSKLNKLEKSNFVVERNNDERTVFFFGRNNQSLSIETRKKILQFENELYDAGILVPLDRFIIYWVAATFIIPLILIFIKVPSIACAGVAVAIAFAPIMYIRFKNNKRTQAIEDALPEAINVICSALRAGQSFNQAMVNVGHNMDGPIAEEFTRVGKELAKGMSVDESLGRLTSRIKSDDLFMMCQAVIIQHEVGGNLAQVLDNNAETIRTRIAMKKKARAATAQGRMSGIIIGLLPVILFFIIISMNEMYRETFINTTTGHYMLLYCVISEIIGFVVIKKITTIKF